MLELELKKIQDQALLSVKEEFNIKTACDYVLSQNINNVFKTFESEQIAKQIINETISKIDVNKKEYEKVCKDNDGEENVINKIYKVFKILQYLTLISEQIYIVKTKVELHEEKYNEDNEHIYEPLIQILHEGIVNRVLKIYDKTKIKRKRSFSIINIQRDFGLKETRNKIRDEIRNSNFAHLSLNHDEYDTEMIEDYTELYKGIKADILETITQVAPFTTEFVSRIVLLNDLPNANSIGRLYSNKNYHKLVMHTDEKFKDYYIHENN